MIKKYLVLSHIKIHNANAFSSPITIGFPAVTSFLGFIHALQRQLSSIEEFSALTFNGVAIISHGFNLHTYKDRNSFESSVIGTSNPLDKTGKRPSFIAEPRCDLEISLIVEYEGIGKLIEEAMITQIKHFLNGSMKVAGGDIISIFTTRSEVVDISNSNEVKRLIRSLMPGFVLIERRDLLTEDMHRGKDVLQSCLDYLAIHHNSTIDENDEVLWDSSRKAPGWIIPIATGFQGISDVEIAKNQRDAITPHRFAESVITLGEFLMLHKIKSIEDILWRHHYKQEENLYVCQTNTNKENQNG